MERILRTRLTTALVLAAVFVSGLLLGLAMDKSLDATPAEGSSGVEQERAARRTPMYEKVDPSEAQKILIDSIVRDYRGAMKTLHNEFRSAYDPRYKAIVEQARTSIKGVLTPEQAQAYDSLLAESDRRHAERRSRQNRDGR